MNDLELSRAQITAIDAEMAALFEKRMNAAETIGRYKKEKALPVKDAVMLSPIELAEVNALASVYDIPQDNSLRRLLDATMELGVVSMAARGAISIIDRSARKRVLSAAKSALIAATIVAGVGICSAYAFEQVYLGKVSLNELGIFNKIKNTGAWQKVSGSVSGGLEKVMSEDALEGFKVSLSELFKTVAPMA